MDMSAKDQTPPQLTAMMNQHWMFSVLNNFQHSNHGQQCDKAANMKVQIFHIAEQDKYPYFW